MSLYNELTNVFCNLLDFHFFTISEPVWNKYTKQPYDLVYILYMKPDDLKPLFTKMSGTSEEINGILTMIDIHKVWK